MSLHRRSALLGLASLWRLGAWLGRPYGLGAAAAAAWPAEARSDAAPPRLLLAREAPPGVDPRPFLVSEKYDGVRAFWDGQRLRSRRGRTLHAPASFLAGLPDRALDGELWLGRGRFDALSGLVRTERPVADGWRDVQYLVFELPDAPGSFADRAAQLTQLAATLPQATWRAVEQRRISDGAALWAQLREVVAQGGEGLMLHRADAPYVTGRQDVLLKLKLQHDAEAVVVGHRPGTGKLQGLMGALEVETRDGRRFLLGTGFNDELRRQPPPVGSVVTYRYLDLTPQGLPRFASFLRMSHEPS